MTRRSCRGPIGCKSGLIRRWSSNHQISLTTTYLSISRPVTCAPANNGIGQRVRSVRLQRNLTLVAAQEIGIDPTLLWKIENGARRPSRIAQRKLETLAGGENLTLMESDLKRCLPIRVQGGRRLRAYCPFHDSDHQRSLSVDAETGCFKCFACGAWGYLDSARERWAKNRRNPSKLATRKARFQRRSPEPSRADLAVVLQNYQHTLTGIIDEQYLHSRGITLALAQRYALGYASAGQWVASRIA